MVTLNTITNGYNNAGRPAISKDGNWISVTATNPDNSLNEAARYHRPSGTWEYLGGIGGVSDGASSSAWNMSQDGSTVVGLGWVSGGRAHAFKWKSDTGMVDLGSTVTDRSSRANGTRYDGSIVVGWQDSPTGFRQGAVWNAAGE